MKNSSDTIENRNRDLPSFSAVPQPTAPPRARNWHVLRSNKEYSYNANICERITRVFLRYETNDLDVTQKVSENIAFLYISSHSY